MKVQATVDIIVDSSNGITVQQIHTDRAEWHIFGAGILSEEVSSRVWRWIQHGSNFMFHSYRGWAIPYIATGHMWLCFWLNVAEKVTQNIFWLQGTVDSNMLKIFVSTGVCNNLENHLSYMLHHRDCKYTNNSKKLEWITIFGCLWLKGSGRSKHALELPHSFCSISLIWDTTWM